MVTYTLTRRKREDPLQRRTAYGLLTIDTEVLQSLAQAALIAALNQDARMSDRDVTVSETADGYGVDLYVEAGFGLPLFRIGDRLAQAVGAFLLQALAARPLWITVHVEKIAPPAER